MSTEEKAATKITFVIFTLIIGAFIVMFFVLRPDEGKEGGHCFKDGSCYAGLGCKSQKCVKIPDGEEGGECLPNGNCMGKLSCNKYRFCEGKKAIAGGGCPCSWRHPTCCL